MLLTEDEAKTKECRAVPVVPVLYPAAIIDQGIGYSNRCVPAVERPTCIASGCMHWRWGEPEYEYSAGVDVNVESADGKRGWSENRPPAAGWEATPEPDWTAERIWRRFKAQRGYCGLAGRP